MRPAETLIALAIPEASIEYLPHGRVDVVVSAPWWIFGARRARREAECTRIVEALGDPRSIYRVRVAPVSLAVAVGDVLLVSAFLAAVGVAVWGIV